MKTYIVTLTTGCYSDTEWRILRAFSTRQRADEFKAALDGLIAAREEVKRHPDFDYCGPEAHWSHPLIPGVDQYNSDPRISVEEVETDGAWRHLAGGAW